MPELFNVHGFGPSVPFTEHATCSWVDHGVSGRMPTTCVEAFASTGAILRLAFATAPGLDPLALPLTNTRRSIMQKVRRHPFPCGHRAPTACKCMVSGTFNSARRRTFHRSIALLIHYRSSRSIQPWAVGRPDSREIPRVSRYSGTPLNGDLSVSHTGLSPSVVGLSRPFCCRRFCNPSRRPQPRDESRFGLFPLSLAATDGIDVSFFSSGYLDVSVPRVRSLPPMNSAAGDPVLPGPRFRIQKSPDRCLIASFPELIAGFHVFRRFSMPRHPPYTLKSLTTFIDHRHDPKSQI